MRPLLCLIFAGTLLACSDDASGPFDRHPELRDFCREVVDEGCPGETDAVWLLDERWIVHATLDPPCSDYGQVVMIELDSMETVCGSWTTIAGEVFECEPALIDLFRSFDLRRDDLGLDPALHAVFRIGC